MNKPVIVSEEALVAPVMVPDVTAPSAAKGGRDGPAYVVLGGISLSHFLNDTMQSLIRVGLSDPEGQATRSTSRRSA